MLLIRHNNKDVQRQALGQRPNNFTLPGNTAVQFLIAGFSLKLRVQPCRV